MKTVVITGATGFIGERLSHMLLKKRYRVIAVSRKCSGRAFECVHWDSESLIDALNGAFAVINLAGDNIGSGIWTPGKKKKIVDSRIKAGENILASVRKVKNRPEVFIQASATGYYGHKPEEMVNEESQKGTGFLSDLCEAWENSTKDIEELGIRRIVSRISVVLGKNGGILSRYMLPFKFFAGTVFGSGKQHIAWIHIDDACKAIIHLMENKDTKGVYNLTAPASVYHIDMMKTISTYMKRPLWIKVPEFVVKMLPGKMGEELLLHSHLVSSKKLRDTGFVFEHEKVNSAINEILSH